MRNWYLKYGTGVYTHKEYTMHILIADDNQQIVAVLEAYAKREGHTVTTAFDGQQALEKALSSPVDLILLDVMMPNLGGFEVCKEIRKHSMVPIIMVTARGEDYDRIMGLEIGADDYVVKPFSPKEVMARIKAITRRVTPPGNLKTLTWGSLTVNIANFTTQINGTQVPLTKKETEILWTLAQNIGNAISRDELLNEVWGYDFFGDTRTVDTHIKRLRAKLDEVPHPDWDIKTIWGVGYKIEAINGAAP